MCLSVQGKSGQETQSNLNFSHFLTLRLYMGLTESPVHLSSGVYSRLLFTVC